MNIRNLLGISCLVAIAGATQGKADLIDVQFSQSGAAMTGAAATGSAGDQWNDITSGSSDSNLNDVSGTATGVGLSMTDAIGHSFYTSGTGFDALMSGYFVGFAGFNPQTHQGTPAPATFSLTGLQAGGSYSLYVYTASNTGMRSEAVTVNGTSHTVSDMSFGNSFQSGANYTEFSVVADLSGNLSFTVEDTGGAFNPDPETDVNGFQLQTPDSQSSSDATPEPSTWGLLGSGVALLMAVARKRHNAGA